jgi:hypothetical protein
MKILVSVRHKIQTIALGSRDNMSLNLEQFAAMVGRDLKFDVARVGHQTNRHSDMKFLQATLIAALLFAANAASAKCTPFIALSYHGGLDTKFNETHPGIKSYNEPSLVYTYQKDKWGDFGYMLGAAFGYKDTILKTGTRLVPRPSAGITYKPNKHMMFYGAPTGFRGDYIIGVELSLF